jgi:hypothetical protein
MTDPMMPGLGRRPDFDPRSRAFPVRALVDERLPLRTRRWWIPSAAPVLDQGAEGACVGFAVTNELRATPRPALDLDGTYAREAIYWEAQKIDPWDGGAYPGAHPWYEGTSVLAGIKTAAAAGWYREYRWAFGEPDLAAAISHVGPAVLGLPWYRGMMQPDEDGHLQPTGEVVGGHAVLCLGINVPRAAYVIYNSWGPGWGDRGRAWIARDAMARLLADDGEACIPTVRSRPGGGR